MVEIWQEISSTISKNKLRTILTGFSVAWGIFILMILLGTGKGLENGVNKQFGKDAVNSLWFNGGKTANAYQGIQPGKDIKFTNEDFNFLKQKLINYESISSRLNLWGISQINYKKNYGSFSIRGCNPGMLMSEKVNIIKGRFVNEIDVKESRKVACVGHMLVKELFKTEDPMGKEIKINDISFKIIGVYNDNGGERDNRRAYIPVTTAQKAFTGENKIDQIVLTLPQEEMNKSEQIAQSITMLLSQRHHFDPEDKKAVFVWNNFKEYQKVIGVIIGIRIFVWIIGIGTLIAGIVGVSNIMIIAVKERTKEIGIRKAIGATPVSIISLVLLESVIITSFAGYIGMTLGIAILEIAKKLIPDADYFSNPDVDIKTALYATLLLVMAGLIAGFFPARKAAKVEPIEALRAD